MMRIVYIGDDGIKFDLTWVTLPGPESNVALSLYMATLFL